MTQLAKWSRSRIAALWAAGFLVEAALITVMAILLVRPDPPLVAQLRGANPSSVQVVFTQAALDSSDALPQAPEPPSPSVGSDSFFTVVHWPLNKPLLAGGGHVLVLPMWMWWAPALYVGAVPLILLTVTAVWLRLRHRARHPTSPA